MRMCILTEAREDVGILSQGFSLSLKLLVLDRHISQQDLSVSTPTSNIKTIRHKQLHLGILCRC